MRTLVATGVVLLVAGFAAFRRASYRFADEL